MKPAKPLLPVSDALERILLRVRPLGVERAGLNDCLGRVLAKDVKATRDQPAFDCSAMDGYAVRARDVEGAPVSLTVRGVSRAGHAYTGKLRAGEAVRIFTGAPLPPGSDSIVIQENTTATPGTVQILKAARPGEYVRARGFDFKRSDVLLTAPKPLNARDLGLAASANHAQLPVRRKPRVVIIGTGDELVAPGGKPRPDQIISSNNIALSALIRQFGGEVIDLGIVADKMAPLKKAIARAKDADILLTSGGASVGEHDLVQQALLESGIKLDFWRIAMRPGKPLMFARRKSQRIIGLPGNPVSALVCSRIFVKPLIDALLGLPGADDTVTGRLAAALPANDHRQDYLRANVTRGDNGELLVTPYLKQDSSMQRMMATADALAIRPPNAPPAQPGDPITVLPLDF